jgi:hypothetical protein
VAMAVWRFQCSSGRTADGKGSGSDKCCRRVAFLFLSAPAEGLPSFLCPSACLPTRGKKTKRIFHVTYCIKNRERHGLATYLARLPIVCGALSSASGLFAACSQPRRPLCTPGRRFEAAWTSTKHDGVAGKAGSPPGWAERDGATPLRACLLAAPPRSCRNRGTVQRFARSRRTVPASLSAPNSSACSALFRLAALASCTCMVT